MLIKELETPSKTILLVKQFCGTKQYNYVKHKRLYIEEKLNLVMKST